MKKFFAIVSAVLAASVALSGCTAPRGAHMWAEEWSNEEYNGAPTHWHACLDENCTQRGEYGYCTLELVNTITASTCQTQGEGEFECTTCGYRVTQPLDLADHTYEIVSRDVEETCWSTGLGTRQCQVCGKTEEHYEIPATGDHNFASTWTGTPEGHYHVCTNTRGTGASLSHCSAHDELIPHIKDGGTRTEPVGDKDGKIEYRCTVCHYLMETVAIPPEGVCASFEVQIVNGSQTVALTLAEDGYYDCDLRYGIVSGGNDIKYKVSAINAKDAKGNPVDAPLLHGYFYNDLGSGEYIGFNMLGEPARDTNNVPVRYISGLPGTLWLTRAATNGVCLFVLRYESQGVDGTVVRAEVRIRIHTVNS